MLTLHEVPPLADILDAPGAQALPYIFNRVMGGPNAALGLMFLVLVITLFCSISITNAASRATWAFARDDAIPGAKLWAKVNDKLGIPLYALALVTVVQMLLGFINLGSTSAFTAFVSVGVQALALSYALPIACSLFTGRKEVNQARWTMGPLVGTAINIIALAWISFELVLFSMPTALPVTAVSMNYASVVLVGFGAIAALWYAIHSRKGKWDGSSLEAYKEILTETSLQGAACVRGFVGRFCLEDLESTADVEERFATKAIDKPICSDFRFTSKGLQRQTLQTCEQTRFILLRVSTDPLHDEPFLVAALSYLIH